MTCLKIGAKRQSEKDIEIETCALCMQLTELHTAMALSKHEAQDPIKYPLAGYLSLKTAYPA